MPWRAVCAQGVAGPQLSPRKPSPDIIGKMVTTWTAQVSDTASRALATGAHLAERFGTGALEAVRLRAGLGSWFLLLLASCVTLGRFPDLSKLAERDG